ncbi:DUF2188 domain-containing protein [Rubrivirga sp. IMCC45206]|uniref:DUF2188 domain-containing protein n=1 Tax=Rubrivirga sp. IMCC45206 TaxID=3391614 RepID=UPI00399011A9
MPSRNVYHVVPHDSRWAVRLEGSPSLSYEADDRDAAVDRASGYIRQLGMGRVVVHSDEGRIETVHTFDQLPAPTGSWRDAVLSQPFYLAAGAALLIAFGYGLSRR